MLQAKRERLVCESHYSNTFIHMPYNYNDAKHPSLEEGNQGSLPCEMLLFSLCWYVLRLSHGCTAGRQMLQRRPRHFPLVDNFRLDVRWTVEDFQGWLLTDIHKLAGCRSSLDTSDDHMFSISLNPPLATSSRPGCVPQHCDISADRKWAIWLALFSSTTIKLSQLPIHGSLLSTSLLIPLLFPLFRFALVTPLIEFWRYRSRTTSTLVHLFKKWETTNAVKLSLHFAPVVFPRDWTAALPFFCNTLPRSDLLETSLRHPSSVAIDRKVLVVRECPHQLHGQILGQLPLVSTDLHLP